MKNTNLFTTLVSLLVMLLLVSCDTNQETSQIGVINSGEQILPRKPLDECEDCPIGCCCCGIEWVSGNFIPIELCGLCEGDYICGSYSPDPPCSTISGIGKNITFSLTHRREVFCVEPGASIRIYNPHSTLSISFRFACDYDVPPPSFQTVTLGPLEERFFLNDGSCMVDPCI